MFALDLFRMEKDEAIAGRPLPIFHSGIDFNSSPADRVTYDAGKVLLRGGDNCVAFGFPSTSPFLFCNCPSGACPVYISEILFWLRSNGVGIKDWGGFTRLAFPGGCISILS